MKDAFTPLTSGDDRPVSLHNNPLISSWVRIDPAVAGIVEIYSGKVELGQGILTAIAQIAADELGLPVARVRMVNATTGRSPNESMTSNSLSIQHSAMSVRIVCRQIRQMYIDAISVSQKIDPSAIVVRDGDFFASSTRCGSYWESRHLVHLDVPAMPGPEKVSGNEPGLVGKPMVSLATAELVTGRYRFIHDMPLNGGLHGRVLRPPSINARLLSLDTSLVEMSGVHKIVREGSLVGVLSAHEHIAERALSQLAALATWDERPCMAPEAELGDWMRTQKCDTRIQTKTPSQPKTPDGPIKTYTADYFKPFIKHASIGPSCAYAQFSGPGRLDVWSHTQGIYNLRADLATTFDMAPEDVIVNHVPGSGCYGHNGADDAAFDAAWLASQVRGTLVRVQWSRADELCWSPQGPAASIHVEADVDAHGGIIDWRQSAWSPGHSLRPGRAETPTLLGTWYLERGYPRLSAINAPTAAGGGTERNIVPLYDISCSELASHRVIDMPMRTSSLRCLGAFSNVFAIESMIDDIAIEHGIDPIQYRIDRLTDERAIDVLKTVRRTSRWDSPPAGTDQESSGKATGMGIGFAQYKNKSGYCAVVACVEIGQSVAVKDLYITVDVGEVINPLGVERQIEGGAIQATSWATLEAAHFDANRLLDDDWEKYPIIRFSEVPNVHITILSRPHHPVLGCGEAAQAPTAAAIANAVRAALGVRVTTFPLTFDNISSTIENAA